MHTSTDANNHV